MTQHCLHKQKKQRIMSSKGTFKRVGEAIAVFDVFVRAERLSQTGESVKAKISQGHLHI